MSTRVVCGVVLLLATVWTGSVHSQDPDDPAAHPCDRACSSTEKPKTCVYNFTVEWYLTMSKACKKCPFILEDCSLPQCVPADGRRRAFVAVNRQLPGPAIKVCQGDTVVVAVGNYLDDGEGTTVHWHGIHQRGTPYMDGADMVTQCPIGNKDIFTYEFKAEPAGTHFWHSHTGYQKSDGMHGHLIVKAPPDDEPHYDLYDHDCDTPSGDCEYAIMIEDWLGQPGMGRNAYFYHFTSDYTLPMTALLNGKNGKDKVVDPKYPDIKSTVPWEVFDVVPGKRYRFRFVSAVGFKCAFKAWVDGHKLTVIASDGSPVQPLELDVFNIAEGERFDFILEANQQVGNYWLQVWGLFDCAVPSASVFGKLRYQGAPNEPPPEREMDRLGKFLNPIERISDFPKYYNGGGDNDIYLNQLSSMKEENFTDEVVDVQHYLAMNMYENNEERYYSSVSFPDPVHVLQRGHRTPVINNISFLEQTVPVLTQLGDLDTSLICDNTTANKPNCYNDLCFCTHVLKFDIGQVVELVLLDEGNQSSKGHPMHLHGGSFRVLAMGKVGIRTWVETIREMDEAGLIERKLINPIYKDTIMIQDGGYVVVRLKTDNPGIWLFHCHRENHAVKGQTVVFQVGEPSDIPPVPTNMPYCGRPRPTAKCPSAPKMAPSTAKMDIVNIWTFFLVLMATITMIS